MDRSDVSEANSTAAGGGGGGGPGVAGGVAPSVVSPAGEQAVPAPLQPSEVSMERPAQPQAPPAEEKSGK